MSVSRDFSTISPSARALLLVKAQTTLPYARAAAELLFGVEAVAKAGEEAAASHAVLGRQRHFELRAHNIDEVLRRRKATRVLELAAGLSMRELAAAQGFKVAAGLRSAEDPWPVRETWVLEPR